MQQATLLLFYKFGEEMMNYVTGFPVTALTPTNLEKK